MVVVRNVSKTNSTQVSKVEWPIEKRVNLKSQLVQGWKIGYLPSVEELNLGQQTQIQLTITSLVFCSWALYFAFSWSLYQNLDKEYNFNLRLIFVPHFVCPSSIFPEMSIILNFIVLHSISLDFKFLYWLHCTYLGFSFLPDYYFLLMEVHRYLTKIFHTYGRTINYIIKAEQISLLPSLQKKINSHWSSVQITISEGKEYPASIHKIF